ILNKVALITGGKRIGVGVAEELAKRGVDIDFSYYSSPPGAEGAAARVRAAGRRAVVVQADLQVPEACSALVAEAARMMGRLDILINMASVYAERPFEQVRAADWNAGLDVDLRGAFFCAQAAVPHMREQGG